MLQPDTELLSQKMSSAIKHGGLIETSFSDAEYVLMALAHGGGPEFSVSQTRFSPVIGTVNVGGNTGVVSALSSYQVPAGSFIIPKTYVHLYLIPKNAYSTGKAELAWEAHISSYDLDIKGREDRFLKCAWEEFPKNFKSIRYIDTDKIKSERGSRLGSPLILADSVLEGNPLTPQELMQQMSHAGR